MAFIKLGAAMLIFFLAAGEVYSAITDCLTYGNLTDANRETCIQCRDGRSPTADGLSCILCPVGCFSCDSKSICLSCYLGFRLVDGSCTSRCADNCTKCGLTGCETCQRGFYLNTSFSSCFSCGDRCQECTKGGTCDICNDEWQKTHIKDTLEDFFCDEKPSKVGLWVVLGLAIALFLIGIGLCICFYESKNNFLYRTQNYPSRSSELSVNNGLIQGQPLVQYNSVVAGNPLYNPPAGDVVNPMYGGSALASGGMNPLYKGSPTVLTNPLYRPLPSGPVNPMYGASALTMGGGNPLYQAQGNAAVNPLANQVAFSNPYGAYSSNQGSPVRRY